MNSDPKLAAELRIQDQGVPWQPKQPQGDTSRATGTDHTSSFARSTIQDGRVVATQSGGTSLSSVDAIAREANSAASTPYSRAVDGRNSQPLLPHQIKDDSILTFDGRGQVTAAQAIGEETIGGRSLHDKLAATIASNAYQNAADGSATFKHSRKVDMIEHDIDRYRMQALRATLRDYPDLQAALRNYKIGAQRVKSGQTPPSDPFAVFH